MLIPRHTGRASLFGQSRQLCVFFPLPMFEFCNPTTAHPIVPRRRPCGGHSAGSQHRWQHFRGSRAKGTAGDTGGASTWPTCMQTLPPRRLEAELGSSRFSSCLSSFPTNHRFKKKITDYPAALKSEPRGVLPCIKPAVFPVLDDTHERYGLFSIFFFFFRICFCCAFSFGSDSFQPASPCPFAVLAVVLVVTALPCGHP